MTKFFNLDKDFLSKEIKIKTSTHIARENKCHVATVRYRLKKYGLPLKSQVIKSDKYDSNLHKDKFKKGLTYGLLTIVEFFDKSSSGKRYICTCACGNFTILRGSTITSKNSLSCGCHQRRYYELRSTFKAIEGLTKLEKKILDGDLIIPPELKNKISRSNNKLKNRQRIKNMKFQHIGDLTKQHWKNILFNADRRGIIIEVSQEYCWNLYKKQQGLCAISGLPIILGEKSTASLDRINSLQNYVPDNIQWVDKNINKMKSDLTEDKFIDFCKAVAQYRN